MGGFKISKNPANTIFSAFFIKSGERMGRGNHVSIQRKKGSTKLMAKPLFSFRKNGAEGQNRTADTGIFSPYHAVLID